MLPFLPPPQVCVSPQFVCQLVTASWFLLCGQFGFCLPAWLTWLLSSVDTWLWTDLPACTAPALITIWTSLCPHIGWYYMKRLVVFISLMKAEIYIKPGWEGKKVILPWIWLYRWIYSSWGFLVSLSFLVCGCFCIHLCFVACFKYVWLILQLSSEPAALYRFITSLLTWLTGTWALNGHLHLGGENFHQLLSGRNLHTQKPKKKKKFNSHLNKIENLH